MMRYDYRAGAKQTPKAGPKILTCLVVLVMIAGYFSISAMAPSIPAFATGSVDVARLLKTAQTAGSNRLYIPRLNVTLPIMTGDTEAALAKGAWQRTPRSGNPKVGGHFVLSAYKYTFAATPAQTRDLSPFYHLSDLQTGDQLYVDYGGTRYVYQVTDVSHTSEPAEKLEQRINIDRMSLYAVDKSGDRADDVLVNAEPLGVVAWREGGPMIRKYN